MSALTFTSPLLPDDVTKIDGGWRVRTTGKFHLDVLKMAYGWRIVTTFKDSSWSYERGWCFREDLATVMLRCFTFEPDEGQEPTGWVKEIRTERRACAGYYRTRVGGHRGYEADCPDCGNEALA